ncbi:MAG: hypothetical protein M3Y29_08815 [Chloroflexota bacterium]|nr:hypothetical protein [Chloroflexota bacterium]
MTIDEAFNGFATFIAFAVAAPAHALVLIYGLGSPWYRSLLGVSIFAKWLSVALIFDFLIMRRLFGEFPGYGVAAVAVYGFAFLAFSAVVVEVVIERRNPAAPASLPLRKDVPMGDLTEGGKHIAVTTDTVPEIWYKAQRVVRTIVQALVVLLPVANGVAAALAAYLAEQEGVAVPGWVFLVLNGTIAVTALIMGAVARIMAVPGVNALLTKIGLGSVPADAVKSGKV